MSAHYRHTQIGWVILASLIGAVVLIGSLTPLAQIPGVAVVALVLVAIPLLLFATLTVEVDASEIRMGFTGGLIHKRIALTEVTHQRAVRNHWLNGWGIKLIPGGWMWNVSGLDAVELVLGSGRVFRIGTDEPEALLQAIERVTPRAEASAADKEWSAAPRATGGRNVVLPVAVVAVVATGVLVLWLVQTRPPVVSVTPQRITVDSLFYGGSYPMDAVVDVTLERNPPRILARTNGFAGGGSLRGWFRVEGLGEGKLFVERGSPPYLFVRLRQGFVIVNYRQPEKTEALFAELQRKRQGG